VKKITLIWLLLIISSWGHAKTIYVTDNIEVNLRSGDTNKSKIIATLASGAALTYISQNKGSHYIKVQMPNGRYAFILKNNTVSKLSDKTTLTGAASERDKFKLENEELDNELLMLKGNLMAAETRRDTLMIERDKLAQKLEDLNYTTTHAIKIKEQRDSLQEQVVQAQKEFEKVKLENQTLKANTKLDWFLYGGTAVFFSIILGFLLPKLSWRKSSHSWD
jgi:SH3 domain protein